MRETCADPESKSYIRTPIICKQFINKMFLFYPFGFIFFANSHIYVREVMARKTASASTNNDDISDGRIVSSRHLVSERCAELSELEYALIMTSNAFNKWMVRCMTAAGEPDMGAFDVSLLHHVNHRNRKKKLADICFVLNVEDTHVVTYALKKLVKAGYVTSEKVGKELYFSTTEEGKALCMRYRDVREACLIAIQVESGIPGSSIGDTAQLLRTISSLYDTAARAAASL